MELQLENKELSYYGTVLDTSAIHDESVEIIVPDASPDIMRIVSAHGSVFLKDKKTMSGKIEVSGIVKGCVLYISEGDMVIRKLDVTIPFSHAFLSNIVTEETEVVVSSWLQAFEAREINPRKISVKANIGLNSKAYERTQREICTGIVDTNEYGIQQKYAKSNYYIPIAMKKKSFTISDDVELSDDKKCILYIVEQCVNLEICDTKIIGSKAVVKGNAYLTCVYMTDKNSILSGEYEIPFSQIVDLDDECENKKLNVVATVRSAEVEPQCDMTGQVHYVSVNILVDMCAFVFENDEIDTIEDIYSTEYSLVSQEKTHSLPMLSASISKRVSISESLETAVAVESVLSCVIKPEPCYIINEENGKAVKNDATCEIIYSGKDGGVYCITRRIGFSCPIDGDGDNYRVQMHLSGKTFSVSSENRITVNAFADYEIEIGSNKNLKCISSVEIDTENKKYRDNVPSVTIKYINSDQPLWETAKKYNTTVNQLAAANALDDEETIKAGSMLLIPKAQC